MFVNKLLAYLTSAYPQMEKLFWCEIFNILFSYEDCDIGIFLYLHYVFIHEIRSNAWKLCCDIMLAGKNITHAILNHYLKLQEVFNSLFKLGYYVFGTYNIQYLGTIFQWKFFSCSVRTKCENKKFLCITMNFRRWHHRCENYFKMYVFPFDHHWINFRVWLWGMQSLTLFFFKNKLTNFFKKKFLGINIGFDNR